MTGCSYNGNPLPFDLDLKGTGHAFQNGDLDVPGLERTYNRMRADLHLDSQGIDGYVAHTDAFEHTGQFPRIGVVHGRYPALDNRTFHGHIRAQ